MRLGLQVRKNPFATRNLQTNVMQQPAQLLDMEMNEESKSPMKMDGGSSQSQDDGTSMINTISGKSTATSNGFVFGRIPLNSQTNKKQSSNQTPA